MNQHLRANDVCALILAGGQSTRMGGHDKAWMPLHGRPLIRHVLDRLAAQTLTPSRTVISANRHLDAYRALGHAVVGDLSEHSQGPLAGIQAALKPCTEPMLLWVPCDAPHFPLDLLARLLAGKRQAGAKAAVACSVDAHGQPALEPCFALIDTDLAPSLDAALALQARKLGDWLLGHAPALVHFAEPEQRHAFRNINTADELQAAAAQTLASTGDSPP
jgi:molybdenum cofactor guanylyltransferase